MKLRNLFITLGLSLAAVSAGVIASSRLNAKEFVKTEAHSTSGLTLVHQGNSESLVGRNAYVIGSNTSHGIRNDGKFGQDGTLLEFVIAEGTSGSTIRLTRADNGKYLNDPVNGTYSDSPVNRYIDSNYYLCADSATEEYYRGGKYFDDPTTIEYEAYDPDMPTALSLVTKFQVWAAPAKLNLKVNDQWFNGARFAAHFFGKGEEETWSDMTLVSGSTRLFEVAVPEGYTKVNFCRMDGATSENNWTNRWNQTGDLSVTDGNYYLMYDDSWDTGVWYDGSDSVYVVGDFSTPAWAALDDYKLEWDRLSGQYEVKAFDALPKNCKFQVLDQTTNAWAGYVGSGMTNDYSLFSNDGDDIICNSNTAYDIYYKPLHYKIWIEENATVAADKFANTFLSVTGAVCVDSSKTSGDTDPAALAAVWNVKATPDGNSLVEKWNALSSGAKGTFAAGTATEDITNAHNRYIHIMSRYSDVLTAFTDGPAFATSSQLTINNVLANNTLVIIAIIVSTSMIAVGTMLFVIKKRKTY